MCTRFVYNGDDTITGFNFDIDLAVWDHKLLFDESRFGIGIKMPDGVYHMFHGVHAGGNAGTLLYVHGNEKAAVCSTPGCVVISDLAERYVKSELTFDEALEIVRNRKIVYAPDATMQAMLSDSKGRALIVEPGIGFRLEEKQRYSLITNYSLLNPASTQPYIVPGDDRYERAKEWLEQADDGFSVQDAFALLYEVRQEGLWATRVSFVFSARQDRVYYALNNDFSNIREHRFAMA
ncbi:MAG TPA: conjugal transfer protein [Eubacteriales bacterium]|nr:conjugal transfer protein [Eubacteriales bacterium]